MPKRHEFESWTCSPCPRKFSFLSDTRHIHVTDTDSFVRDVVAKELIDLKRCRENMKEKLLGPEDSDETHQQKSVPKRRVSLGGTSCSSAKRENLISYPFLISYNMNTHKQVVQITYWMQDTS